MNELLSINNFSCGYSSQFYISVKDITINRGDFCGIIGPNGAGKTTLFRGITGELAPNDGKVLFLGNDLHQMKRQERAKSLAIVNQNVGSPSISVEDYVLLGRMPHQNSLSFIENKKDFEVAHHYMNVTNTYRFKDKMMNQLSGGEQQLCAIARALAQEPQLLLFDEPTSHLDISHAVQVLNLLQSMNNECQLTIMIVIHDLNLAGEYCEQLIMMESGQVLIKGAPNAVLTYENIEKVYKTPVITQRPPLSGRPAVFPISQRMMEKGRELQANLTLLTCYNLDVISSENGFVFGEKTPTNLPFSSIKYF